MSSTFPYSMWTVYCRPRDFPHGYIARRGEIIPGQKEQMTNDIKFADTLEGVRALLPPEFTTCIPRNPEDQPQIVEVWIR